MTTIRTTTTTLTSANNASSTTTLATTILTAPSPPTIISTASLSPITNSTNSTNQQLSPSLEAFNASVKALFNKTLAQVAKANLTDYTAQYSLPPIVSTSGARDSDGANMDLAATVATASMSTTTRHIVTSTFPASQTVPTFIAGNKNRATTIIVYPTITPESIVIPIVSCIFGFPILALIVICCLRRRAKLARERDRRRNYDMQDHAVSLVRFSPIHRLNYRSSRAVSLRPERSLSQGFTSLELDTVVEERSDVEQTQTELLNVESPLETSTSYKMSISS